MHPRASLPSHHRAIYSRISPKRAAVTKRTAWVLFLWWAHCVGGLEAWLASSLVGCQALPCTDAAGHCLAGPDHKVACGTLGGPRVVLTHWWAARVSKPLGLLPTCWQVKPDPGVSARLLAGRPGSRVWLQGPGVPELSEITGVQGPPPPTPMSDEHTFLSSLLSKSLAFFVLSLSSGHLHWPHWAHTSWRKSLWFPRIPWFSFLLISCDPNYNLVWNLLFPHQLHQCTWTRQAFTHILRFPLIFSL